MKNAENHQPSTHPTINLVALLCVSVFIFLICGCGPDPRDARIEKLAKQVASLQDNQTQLRTNFLNLCQAEADFNTTLSTNLNRIELEIMLDQIRWAGITNQIADAIAAFAPPVRSAAARAPVHPITQPAAQAPATKNGVPISVYNQIVADAEKEWPSDYSMQVAHIENQCEAWQKLHPVK
jgi:hypothetical protein